LGALSTDGSCVDQSMEKRSNRSSTLNDGRCYFKSLLRLLWLLYSILIHEVEEDPRASYGELCALEHGSPGLDKQLILVISCPSIFPQ
jgi:hypothetical protein